VTTAQAVSIVKARKRNVHLKTALVTAAVALAKTRGGYLGEKHRRLRPRRGEMRAHVAITHKILVAACHVLATGAEYVDLGQATSISSITSAPPVT
jgi:transposase